MVLIWSNVNSSIWRHRTMKMSIYILSLEKWKRDVFLFWSGVVMEVVPTYRVFCCFLQIKIDIFFFISLPPIIDFIMIFMYIDISRFCFFRNILAVCGGHCVWPGMDNCSVAWDQGKETGGCARAIWETPVLSEISTDRVQIAGPQIMREI